MKRRFAVIAAALACIPGLVQAQSYPARLMTFVVGYPAGGAVDSLARLLAKRMSEKFGQTIVVDDKPGASEKIAAQHVAVSKPDGYTILVSTEAPITQAQFLYRSLPYNPETQLLPISILVRVPEALTASPKSAADSFAAFVQDAKSRKDGQAVRFGSAGIGGVSHLPAAMLATKAGFKWVHVPYRGSPPLLQDVMAGRVDAGFTGLANALPFQGSGKLRILAVGSTSRVKSLPNVPTFKELGLQEIGAHYIVMLSVPVGTPRDIVNLLSTTAGSILQEKEVQDKFLDPLGFESVGSTADEAASYVATDRPVQRERVRISGANLD